MEQTKYEKQKELLKESANQTIRELFERKSVRVFKEEPISSKAKQMILYAASEAPTAGCQQLYTILDITDQNIKEQLAVTCDNQPFIAKAPLVLVFCTDCRKWYEAFQEAGCEPRQPGVGDLMLAVTDTAIAAQNAVTAAWSLGIGSCYIGDILEQNEEQRRILNLPDYVVPSVMVVFGYPTKQQMERKKPVRIELDNLVAENKYPDRNGEDYRSMFRGRMAGQNFDGWMDKFCKRKYNSDFSREMTRSVEKYLEQFYDCSHKIIQ